MKVFVLLTTATGGMQLIGICATKEQAEECVAHITFGLHPRVEEAGVTGMQPDPDVVYTVEYYEEALDVHYFKGVYGNVNDARRAAGPNGLVLTRRLHDSRLSS